MKKTELIDAYTALDGGTSVDELVIEARKQGEAFSPLDLASLRYYEQSPVDQRTVIKGGASQQRDVAREDALSTYTDLQRTQQETAQEYGPRVEGVTDIRSLADFRDWLGYSLGSGAVQLAPVMGAAMVGGPAGAVAAGTALAASETINNRLSYIQTLTHDLPVEDQAQAMLEYLKSHARYYGYGVYSVWCIRHGRASRWHTQTQVS